MTIIMKMNKIKVVAGVLLVFSLGVLIGVLGTHLHIQHRIEKFAKGGPFARMLSIKKLSAELDLTTLQKAEIEKIVDGGIAQFHEFRRKYRPEIEKIIGHTIELIKEKLDDEQKQKMDDLHEKFRKRRHHRKHRDRDRDRDRKIRD